MYTESELSPAHRISIRSSADIECRDVTETGMARLALSDADRQVRDWFVRTAKELNFKVTIDKMGNIFVVRPGKNPDSAPIMMGSHLDTQPTGGRYDGILGVISGLEVLRTLEEKKTATNTSIGVVNWTKWVIPFVVRQTETDDMTVKRERDSLPWPCPRLFGPRQFL